MAYHGHAPGLAQELLAPGTPHVVHVSVVVGKTKQPAARKCVRVRVYVNSFSTSLKLYSPFTTAKID